MFLTLALLAFFAIALPDAMTGVVWPFMRVTFDEPLAALSLVLPFGVAATLVSTSCWTWAARRLGLGRLLAGSVAVSTVALLCCAVAPGYWVIVACAVLFGLSAGAIDAALNSYAARHFGPRQINFMHAAYGLGAAASPLVASVIVGGGASWRWAYLAVMVVQGGLSVVFAATSRRWDDTVADGDGERSAQSPSSPDKRRWRPPPGAVVGLLVAAVDCGLESAVGLWAFVFLLDAMTLTPRAAGLVVSGYWAALVVGRVLLGAVAERVGTWPVLAAATILVVAAAALVLSHQPAPAAVGVVLLGLAVAPIYPLLVLTTAERTTAASVDRLVGFQAGATTVGSVTCSSIVGVIMGTDARSFAGCLLVLALMTSGGIWVLRPGQRATSTSR